MGSEWFKKVALKLLSKIISEIIPPKIMKNKSNFDIWESKGYHVTPVHYYENIPDTRNFPADIFDRESNLSGIQMNEEEQLKLLADISLKYKDEYIDFSYGKNDNEQEFYFGNGSYETIDAEVLYCMVREKKPKSIIEIGSGYSTLVTVKAIKKNIAEDPSYNCDLICIEPYPKEWLKNLHEVKKIIQSYVEDLPMDIFRVLGENDILFIDSTHTIKVYNDVCFEYLDLLPNLNKGVIIHIHDILLPKYYCKYWFESKFFWNEQYLLQAFLTFNTAFKVLWAGNFMHLKHAKELAEKIPSYSWFKSNADEKKKLQGHKSFWMKKIV